MSSIRERLKGRLPGTLRHMKKTEVTMSKVKLTEYAFDVKMQTVVRVKAATQEEAEKVLASLQEIDWSIVEVRNGLSATEDTLIMLDKGNVRVTEVSTLPETMNLFEIDDEQVCDICKLVMGNCECGAPYEPTNYFGPDGKVTRRI